MIKLPKDIIEAGYKFDAVIPSPKSETEKKPDGSIVFRARFDTSEVNELVRNVARDMTEKIDAAIMDELLRLNGYVPERTCHMVLCDTGEWFTPECLEEYLFCSNCKFVGYYVQVNEDGDYWCAKPNYCPNCGAKVVIE